MTKIVFWIDVDNTLLNNDRAKEDYDEFLKAELGEQLTERFWEIYEQVRKEKGVIDIPLALNRLRQKTPLSELDEQTYLHVHSLFDNYPFQNVLYPHTIETLKYLETIGTPVIVSDGDKVFQAEKITNSSLAEAVQGRVLLYVHKQEHLDEMMQKYPADHYVMIDDKPDILQDTKARLGARVTTVFVKQGHYASVKLPDNFTPDITVSQIAEVRNYSAEQFLETKQ